MGRRSLGYILLFLAAAVGFAIALVYKDWKYRTTHYSIDFGEGPLEIKPIRDDDPLPKVCRNKMELMHFMLSLKANRPSWYSQGDPSDRGRLLHLRYSESPRHSSTREIVFLVENDDGPFVLLDDFITTEHWIAPKLELDGDWLKWVDRSNGTLLRQVTCPALEH